MLIVKFFVVIFKLKAKVVELNFKSDLYIRFYIKHSATKRLHKINDIALPDIEPVTKYSVI